MRGKHHSLVGSCIYLRLFSPFLSCFILQLIFVAKVAPLGLTTYFISSGLGSKLCEHSSITEYNTAGSDVKPRLELNKPPIY